MQSFQILYIISKHVNSAKHWIVIASKTVTGQYKSSTVLQQVNVQSDNNVSLLVYTLICVGSWSIDS